MTRFTALLLALVIAALIAANSAHYFFQHPMYETGDAAAGSLAVDRAKHFAELYGPYSRWGFHHPGPAFFYVQALGEALFFDALKIVPAPFNAQSLVCMLVEVGFFVAALQVFSQWLPTRGRWWFFPLAIGLATLHFGDPSPGRAETLPPCFAFQTTWSAHIVVLLLLSLLAASASVAAGRAEELPLLVLSGGCLVHEHVAQPMFVVPCALLAYGGLIAWQATGRSGPVAPAGSVWRRALARVRAPWQRERPAHLRAGLILVVFLLPLLVDLTRGAQSNFAAIFHHLRTYHGEHKPWLKSVLYFLQFGAYSSYVPGDEKFGAYDTPGVWRYLRAHAAFLAAWGAAYGLAAWALLRQLIIPRNGERAGESTGRFLAWAAVFLFLATGLTLRWGVIQDGEMYYYNAWFNFAIYYFALLIAAALLLSWGLALIARRGIGKPGWLEEGVAILAALLSMLAFGQRLKIVDHSWSTNFAMHNRIAGVMAGPAAPQTVRFLDFPSLAWMYAAAVAVQLDRAGEPFVVPLDWQTMFGAAHTPSIALANLEHTNYQRWRLLLPVEASSPTFAHRKLVPLEGGVDLTVEPAVPVDLNNGGVTLFDFKEGATPPDFQIAGWSGTEPWGEWTQGPRSILVFPAARVDADVELTIDAFPFLVPAHGLNAQRLRVLCNGQAVGPELRLDLAQPPPFKITIPRAVWNGSGSNIVLELQMPDAASPHALDPAATADSRELGLGVRRMLWRGLASNGAASSAPEAGSAAAEADLPAAYVFGANAPPGTACTGVFADGWASREVTVLLPVLTPGPTSFLQLKGLAPAEAGIVYPYRFTTQAGGGARTESIIPAAGPFDIIVPLPHADGVRNIGVRLSFPQTFVPDRVDPASRDHRQLSLLLHSLAITSAKDPLFFRFGEGWDDEESDGKSKWRWSPGEGSIHLVAARAGTLVVQGTASSQAPANALDILLDGAPCQTVPLATADWQPVAVRTPLSAGEHVLTFRSRLPGVRPGGDPRTIAFGLRDATCKLPEQPAPP